MKACGACSLTPVLALIGLVGLGVGGYNWVSTGCPLGSCSTTTATVTTASTSTPAKGDCALCPAHGDAAVTTVADTSKADCSAQHDCAAEAKGGECCKGAGGACCQEGAMKDAAMKACSESAGHCPEGAKTECPMKAAEEAKKTEAKSSQPS